jgi:ribose transport system permease protein/putative xylitol transport system permease protein
MKQLSLQPGNRSALKFIGNTDVLPVWTGFALIILFSLLHPAFLTWPNFWNIVRQSSVLLVASMGSTFIILMGSIDLSIGAIMTLAAITAATNSPTLGPASLLLGLLVGMVCGAINGTLNAILRLPRFLVTLGTLFVFQSVGLIISQGRPRPWSTAFTDLIAGGTVFGAVPKIGLSFLLICMFVAQKTRFGRTIYAIGDDERTAGIHTQRIKIFAFMLAGLIASLAGMFLGIRSYSAAPGMGDAFLLDTIAAVVLGGTALTGGIGGPLSEQFSASS